MPTKIGAESSMGGVKGELPFTIRGCGLGVFIRGQYIPHWIPACAGMTGGWRACAGTQREGGVDGGWCPFLVGGAHPCMFGSGWFGMFTTIHRGGRPTLETGSPDLARREAPRLIANSEEYQEASRAGLRLQGRSSIKYEVGEPVGIVTHSAWRDKAHERIRRY